jgi:hypothetical protein
MRTAAYTVLATTVLTDDDCCSSTVGQPLCNRCNTLGKTSLLDLLAGRLTLQPGARSSGSISVNGSAATPAQMRAISGYVAQ